MIKTFDWILYAWRDSELKAKIEELMSCGENRELTIDDMFRLSFDGEKQCVTVRPFSDTSDFNWKIIPKTLSYRAVLKMLDHDFSDLDKEFPDGKLI